MQLTQAQTGHSKQHFKATQNDKQSPPHHHHSGNHSVVVPGGLHLEVGCPLGRAGLVKIYTS